MFIVASIIVMPVIAMVTGVKIYMYFRDHNPPHFHAQHEGEEEVFDFDGQSLRGAIDKKKGKKIRKWVGKNRNFLQEKWDEFQK